MKWIPQNIKRKFFTRKFYGQKHSQMKRFIEKIVEITDNFFWVQLFNQVFDFIFMLFETNFIFMLFDTNFVSMLFALMLFALIF